VAQFGLPQHPLAFFSDYPTISFEKKVFFWVVGILVRGIPASFCPFLSKKYRGLLLSSFVWGGSLQVV